ncbi:MAG: Na(+)/H(+) antiporter subunit C [Brooklawnia sp.]|uniref:Na(+)/H(+) antiporter subunit C n=1 Tax=Brooklawnia sp. TaxID=2699740 RepID=UPI003C76C19B
MIDVSPSLALLVLVGVLIGCGTVLVLERSLSRVVIGASLITYGVNVMVLMSGGRAGGPPIIGQSEVEEMADPLPQAMVLTAIVIGLALTAFMLAMSYRTWQLNGNDEVQDDNEDRRIALAAARDAVAERVTDDSGASLDDQAAIVFDETEDLPAFEGAVDELLPRRPSRDGVAE